MPWNIKQILTLRIKSTLSLTFGVRWHPPKYVINNKWNKMYQVRPAHFHYYFRVTRRSINHNSTKVAVTKWKLFIKYAEQKKSQVVKKWFIKSLPWTFTFYILLLHEYFIMHKNNLLNHIILKLLYFLAKIFGRSKKLKTDLCPKSKPALLLSDHWDEVFHHNNDI